MADRYAQYQRLKFERPADGVLRIVMSNPGKLNATDQQMHWELAEIWRTLDDDPDFRCAILTGEGNAFSAGGDFEMTPHGDQWQVNVFAHNGQLAGQIT